MLTFNALKKRERIIWTISIGISLLFLLSILWIWYSVNNNYPTSVNRVSTFDEVNQRIKFFEKKYASEQQLAEPLFIVPVGIFIQSFEFLTSTTVQISGYVWQKIKKSDLQRGLQPGVIFPEAKSLGYINKAYESDYPEYKLIGWHFSGVELLQNFNYSNYPFDFQSIWIRMWPKDFDKNIVLIPDLKSYLSIKPGNVFGLENEILKHGFEVKETYFNMPIMHYDTSFGEPAAVMAKNSLELHYNIVIKGRFINAFLIHLIPIIVIWFFLFALTMIITDQKQLAIRVGLSTTQLFIALGGTIFSVVLISNGLRSEYADQAVLYMEYFYLITYVIIIMVSCDAYMITTRQKIYDILRYNLLPKTLFWPIVLGCILLITVLKFFVFPDNFVHWDKF